MPKFVPRERKHKVIARQKNGSRSKVVETFDTYTVELPKSTPSEKELRRQALRDELKSQQIVKSSKKQKRLDKYIVLFLWKLIVFSFSLTVLRIKNCGNRKTLI